MRGTIQVGAVAIVLLTGTRLMPAQPLEFEVATIKVNASGSGSSMFPTLNKGRLDARNTTLSALLQAGYDLGGPRIFGPSWLESDRYDVTGKSPEGVPDAALGPMLQRLLNERFAIVSHREMREMAVLEMTASKDGAKMKPFDPANPPAPPPRSRGGHTIMGTGTMPQLAKMITNVSGSPVLDKTGLEGRFVYVLNFMPLSAQSDETADSPPDLFAAMQQQLGLRLESKKERMEVLVIDRALRVPREN